ncbi:MAG: Hsp70 family protein [bacterium]|nr:Hsp70 family protein [bacterium]
MPERTYLGIGVGDLQLSAAYTAGGDEPVQLAPALQDREAAIYFDPHASISSLGVGFPSVLQSVGSGASFLVGDRRESPESIVERRLARILTEVVEATKVPPLAPVMAIPTAFTQRKRKVLLKSARQTGFENVAFIDTCTAAAIGLHRYGEQDATILALRLGYSDCETALLRFARGRCRAVGSAVVPRVSGEMLDALVMESIVLALREKQVFLGLKQFSSTQWLEFRRFAESARIKLSKQSELRVQLPAKLSAGGGGASIELTRRGLAARIDPVIGRAVEAVEGLLENNELSLDHVDHFLLVGSVAKTLPVSDLLRAAFDGRPRPAPSGIVTLGALVEACHRAERPVRLRIPSAAKAFEEYEPAETGAPDRLLTAAGTEPGGFVSVELDLSTPAEPVAETASPEPVPRAGGDLADARRLLEKGRPQEAESLLRGISREAEALLGGIRSARLKLLDGARDALERGDIAQAVARSHEAYRLAPNDPAVFKGMMAIHVQAGLALDQPHEYERAIQVLQCAHGHDQTDTTVHKAMADRHFQHALHMRKLNNLKKAHESAQAALSYYPKHENAGSLLGEIAAEIADFEP